MAGAVHTMMSAAGTDAVRAVQVAGSGDGGGVNSHVLLVVVIVFLVGVVLHRVLAPLLRGTVHALEWAVDAGFKLGVYLMIAAGVAAALVVLILASRV